MYSIIGWLWETPFVSLKNKQYINRGFLRGPYIPIYGTVCLISFYLLDFVKTWNLGLLPQTIIQIIVISVASAIFEYATSYFLEYFFHKRWWDYSYKKYNLNGRVALDYMVLFGLGGYILWLVLKPITDNLYSNLSSVVETPFFVVLTVFATLMMIDFITTVTDLLKVKQYLSYLGEQTLVLNIRNSEFIKELNEFIRQRRVGYEEWKEKIQELKEKFSLNIDDKLVSFRQIRSANRLYRKFPRNSKLSKYIKDKFDRRD